MRSRRRQPLLVAAACLVVLALSPAPASNGDGLVGVTVYTSLPFDASDKEQTEDAALAEELALAQANNQAGSCQITFRRLDDSTAAAGQWDPGRVSKNARTAAQDASTIAYIGEWNSAASAISIPILNQAGIMQISPSNSALELTKNPGPTGHGAPDKYYPTGRRTYARVAAADHIQGGAQGEWMKALRVKRLFVATDKQVYGAGVAKATADAARRNGIRVVGNAGIDFKARNYRGLARKVKAGRADAFFFGGVTESNAARVYRDVVSANPKIKLFGPDGVADDSFTRRLSKAAQRRMHITVGTYDPADYPPKGQQFVKDFKAGHGGRQPEPYAIYGYEAMSLLLDAMKRASSCSDRSAVIDEVFKTKARDSVLGVYSIDKDGDITTSRYGRFLVANGRLTYDRTATVRRDSLGHPLGR